MNQVEDTNARDVAAAAGPAGTEADMGAIDPQAALAQKIVDRMAFVQQRAMHVAKRLLAARPPLTPPPKTVEGMLDLIDTLAKTPRRYGVFVTEADLKYLRQWHAYRRFKLKMDAKPAAEGKTHG